MRTAQLFLSIAIRSARNGIVFVLSNPIWMSLLVPVVAVVAVGQFRKYVVGWSVRRSLFITTCTRRRRIQWMDGWMRGWMSELVDLRIISLYDLVGYATESAICLKIISVSTAVTHNSPFCC